MDNMDLWANSDNSVHFSMQLDSRVCFGGSKMHQTGCAKTVTFVVFQFWDSHSRVEKMQKAMF